MHLVDTSIWIHALRPEGSARVRSLLRPLLVAGEVAISEWIVLELMTGLRRQERPDVLVKTLAPVHRLEMQSGTWELAWHSAAALRRKGVSATAADCLIAAIAIGHRVPLIHCDADFEVMKRVIPLETRDWSADIR